GKRTMRHVLSVLTLLVLLVSRASAHSLGPKETTLYVWAGDAARQKPDFLAVINFDEASPDYGKVVRTVRLPGPGSLGNEPHHCHLSEDGNVLAAGGLLSVLHSQDESCF